MIEHTAEVIEVTELINHPNADSLSLVMIGDYQCVVRTADWKVGDLAIYIEPDTIVPETEEFAFLGTHRRIKARKLRGQWSMGLLIPAPDGAKIGDDFWEQLGLTHYEPQAQGHFSTGGDNVTPPPGFFPKYDVLNFRKYSHLFEEGEEVIVSEKTHGASSKFVCIDDEIYASSRNFWKKRDDNNLWWKALAQNPSLEKWLRANQNLCVYGEVFGQVQNLKYGAKNGEIFFAAFDILRGHQWLDFDEAHEIGASLPWVPLVYRGPFDKDRILAFAEGDTLYPNAGNIREGAVVKPIHERVDPKIGRVQLKIISNKYLEKS